DIDVTVTKRVCVFHIRGDDIHREVRQTCQDSHERAPAKIPERIAKQLRIDLLLGIGVERLLEIHIHQVEKVEQPNPGDACDKVEPAKNYSRKVFPLRRVKQPVKHSQTDGEMNS